MLQLNFVNYVLPFAMKLTYNLKQLFVVDDDLLYFQYDHTRIEKLSRRLVDRIQAGLQQVIRNGDADHSYPGCVNLSFAYVEGESLLMALKGLIFSFIFDGLFNKSVLNSQYHRNDEGVT